MSLLRRIEKGSGGSGGGGDQGGRGPGDPSGAGNDPNSEESTLAAMRQRRQAIGDPQRPGAGKQNSYLDLKTRVQNKLLSELDHQSMDITRKNEVRAHIEELFNAILADESMVLSRAE